MIRFFVVLLVSALCIAGIVLIIHELHWIAKIPSFFYQTLAFLTLSTAMMYRYLFKINKPGVFVQLYLLIMVVKILAFGAYIFIVVFTDTLEAQYNVVFFIVCYFIFTGLEMFFLLQKIRDDNAA